MHSSPPRSIESRIRAGLVAYAAGDALGVPWEGRLPTEISRTSIDQVPAHGAWPPGATSDDTAQTLLMAHYLSQAGANVDERDFLSRLAAALPDMRGAGPSTRAAVQRFVTTGALRATGGDTNGAAMRAAPIGWAVPPAAADRRRKLSIGLSQTTHAADGAIGSACTVSAMASWALEADSLDSLLEAAVAETNWFEQKFGTDGATFQSVRDAAAGRWSPGPAGVTLNAVESTAAVVHVIRHAGATGSGLADALRYAVSLGGDTDTVAAIVGGVLGGVLADTEIPWTAKLALPDAAELDDLSRALSSLRRSFMP